MDFKKLEEKLKYLLLLDLREKRVMLQNLSIEFVMDSNKKIEFYEVDFQVDYEGVIDAEWNSFKYDIERMFNIVEESLVKFPITPDGELNPKFGNFIVSEPLIWDITYSFDTKHDFHFSYRISYDED